MVGFVGQKLGFRLGKLILHINRMWPFFSLPHASADCMRILLFSFHSQYCTSSEDNKSKTWRWWEQGQLFINIQTLFFNCSTENLLCYLQWIYVYQTQDRPNLPLGFRTGTPSDVLLVWSCVCVKRKTGCDATNMDWKEQKEQWKHSHPSCTHAVTCLFPFFPLLTFHEDIHRNVLSKVTLRWTRTATTSPCPRCTNRIPELQLFALPSKHGYQGLWWMSLGSGWIGSSELPPEVAWKWLVDGLVPCQSFFRKKNPAFFAFFGFFLAWHWTN